MATLSELRHRPRRSPSWLCGFLGAVALVTAVFAGPIRFSIPGGAYTNDLKLELTSGLSSSETIRFTLDGSEPTPISKVYTEALLITNTAVVRAKVFAGGAPTGPGAAATYVLLARDLWDFNSNLPLVVVESLKQSPMSPAKVPALMQVIEKEPAGRSRLTGKAAFDGWTLMNGRGFSSLMFPKRSFTVRIRDDSGSSAKVPMLGMPADSDWILYAPYTDKTLMRDVLAYELSRQMGHYAPRTQFVEVFVGGVGQKLNRRMYAGVYVLEERIKRARQRVNITKLAKSDQKEPEITGGYIIKKDHEEKQGGGFTTSRGIHFFFVEPKDDELTPRQAAWLKEHMNQLEKAVYGSNFKDPVLGYPAYIDVASFIDHHWMVEFSKNIDGYRLSTYLHKDRQGKVKAEPLWDWNLSFGNADYLKGWTPEGWYWPLISKPNHLWYGRLFEDPDFQQRYIDRWFQLRTNQFARSNILAKVEGWALQLKEAQVRNFQRWPILGQHVWPNWFVGASYADEVTWMKRWISQHIAWIDSQFLNPPSFDPHTEAKPSDRPVELRSPIGEIYYTLDGSDPRLPGGAISPKARLYHSPIFLPADATVFARAYEGGNKWSAPVARPLKR